MALLNITTPAELAQLVAAAPLPHRLDVLRAVNPALHAELLRVEASPSYAPARLRKLVSPSAAELVRYVTNHDVLRALVSDKRDTVAAAVIARAAELGVALEKTARTKRAELPLEARTAAMLEKPVADVLAWLVKARAVDSTLLEAWFNDVTPEKAAVWTEIINVSRRFGSLHSQVVLNTFSHDLGPDSLASANEWVLKSALHDWTGPVNGTVLAALIAAVEEDFAPTMYKYRTLTVDLPEDAPFALRTVLGKVTPDELRAELAERGTKSSHTSWYETSIALSIASLATDPGCVEASLEFMEESSSYYREEAAATLLAVPGISFAQRVRLMRIIGDEVDDLIAEGTLSGENLDAFFAALASDDDPAAVVEAVVRRCSYRVAADTDLTWLLERILREVPASATVLVKTHPELTMAHAAKRLAGHPDAWGVVTSEIYSYKGLFDELIDAAIAACV